MTLRGPPPLLSLPAARARAPAALGCTRLLRCGQLRRRRRRGLGVVVVLRRVGVGAAAAAAGGSPLAASAAPSAGGRIMPIARSVNSTK